jgi:hypothetical protein
MKFKRGDKVYIPELRKIDVIEVIYGTLLLVGPNNRNTNPLYSKCFNEDQLIPVEEYRKRIIDEILDLD